MKPDLLNDPFHNPFYNRFNDPVRRRLDDMQSHEYTLWLSERNRALSLPMPVIPRTVKNVSDGGEPNDRTRTLTSFLVLFVVFLISAALLLKTW
jgi:hypothetical protein